MPWGERFIALRILVLTSFLFSGFVCADPSGESTAENKLFSIYLVKPVDNNSGKSGLKKFFGFISSLVSSSAAPKKVSPGYANKSKRMRFVYNSSSKSYILVENGEDDDIVGDLFKVNPNFFSSFEETLFNYLAKNPSPVDLNSLFKSFFNKNFETTDNNNSLLDKLLSQIDSINVGEKVLLLKSGYFEKDFFDLFISFAKSVINNAIKNNIADFDSGREPILLEINPKAESNAQKDEIIKTIKSRYKDKVASGNKLKKPVASNIDTQDPDDEDVLDLESDNELEDKKNGSSQEAATRISRSAGRLTNNSSRGSGNSARYLDEYADNFSSSKGRVSSTSKKGKSLFNFNLFNTQSDQSDNSFSESKNISSDSSTGAKKYVANFAASSVKRIKRTVDDIKKMKMLKYALAFFNKEGRYSQKQIPRSKREELIKEEDPEDDDRIDNEDNSQSSDAKKDDDDEWLNDALKNLFGDDD